MDHLSSCSLPQNWEIVFRRGLLGASWIMGAKTPPIETEHPLRPDTVPLYAIRLLPLRMKASKTFPEIGLSNNDTTKSNNGQRMLRLRASHLYSLYVSVLYDHNKTFRNILNHYRSAETGIPKAPISAGSFVYVRMDASGTHWAYSRRPESCVNKDQI